MRINIASDIHLEFGPIEIKNTEAADVLILSGDICVAVDVMHKDDLDNKSRKIHDFFEMCSKEYKNVIYIVGNHEHYNGDFQQTIPHLKRSFEYLDNLHILDKEIVTIDDVTFIGGKGTKLYPQTPGIQKMYDDVLDDIWDTDYDYTGISLELYTKYVKDCGKENIYLR